LAGTIAQAEAAKKIWTQGELTDNRYWLPGYDDPDDKLITEVNVTFDSKYKVLSNGAKISEKENKDGTKTWHYKMPHPHALYLVCWDRKLCGEYRESCQRCAAKSMVLPGYA